MTKGYVARGLLMASAAMILAPTAALAQTADQPAAPAATAAQEPPAADSAAADSAPDGAAETDTGEIVVMLGLLDPIVAAILMPVSSVTAIVGAWRSRTFSRSTA